MTVASALAALRAGSPPDVAIAVRDLAEAEGRGDPEGARHLATLAGLGIGMPQSWDYALDCLARAAVAGSASARGQLDVLSTVGGGIVDAGDDDDDAWRRRRAAVRVADWLTPCVKRVLIPEPRTVAISAFLAPPVCRWLIGVADGRLQRALTYGAGGAATLTASTRSNSALELGVVETDVVVLLTRSRIAATIGVPPQALETSQILNYQPGEQFARHLDALDPALAEVAANGQRIVTFLVYLSDDFRDGETDFPRLGLRHRGATGDALYFANLDAGGLPDRRTLHAGLPPSHGEKWVFSQWVRNRARL